MDYSKLRFDDSSLSLNEIRSRFNTFIIYESDSNNWERQWNIMNDFCLGEYINYSAKEIYEKMLEDLHAGQRLIHPHRYLQEQCILRPKRVPRHS